MCAALRKVVGTSPEDTEILQVIEQEIIDPATVTLGLLEGWDVEKHIEELETIEAQVTGH